MRFIFHFPDIGEGITEGKIVQWHVAKGQKVVTGDALVKMETDKVVTDIPSPKDGVISATFGAEGDVINVEDALVELEIEGVEGEEAQVVAKEKPKPAEEKPVEEKGFGVVGTLEVAGDGAFLPASGEGFEAAPEVKEEKASRKVLATPVARAMARDFGIDINEVNGTGPSGRVTKADIKAFHGAKPVAPVAAQLSEDDLIEYQPLSQIRKAIARKMVASKQTAAHMTIMEEVEVSKLIKIRREHKESFDSKGLKLTYLPFILKAAAAALKEFPALNSEMDLEKDRMVYKKYYSLGVAVDTDDGLVVPVVRNVDKKSILDLSGDIGVIAEKSRERKLTMDDFKDGTFTVTNYGSIGGTFGVPVINYPQAAILGIGRIIETPVVKDGEVVVGHVLPLSLSVDHRIVDGGDATRFLKRVMELLSDPVSLLFT